MNKYILLLGVAGVALGSYCAYAGNSATITVTATIAHDVSLSVTQDLNIGTITINPANIYTYGEVNYNLDGTVKNQHGAVITATAATPGIFTANIANPSACDGSSDTCGDLSIPNRISSFLGTASLNHNGCDFVINYDSSNKFKVVPTGCDFEVGHTTPGKHEATITVSYTAS
ncbi:MAG: hypothetical protein IJ689_05530 [Alphaproteobacteria bacterium]|nr:hypothetical protein [Alphaproteobacteria bacterium]